MGRDGCGLGTEVSAVRDEDVDVANVFFDLRGDGLEGVLGGYVAYDGYNVSVGRFFGCLFEDFLSSADDVDLMRAVESEGFGHHEADA